MLTILNSIELSTDYLKNKGVEAPRINAELLLAHNLNCKRMDLYLKFDQPLTEDETTKFRKSIKRRGQREPLQYITGSVEFYGLEFNVNKNVLIPRQETEILVEEVIKRTNKSVQGRILDIGSGSGNIAISLCKKLENHFLHSIDISEKAIELAKINAEYHQLNGKLTFQNIDLKDYEILNNSKFDVIVSNPPYIKLEQYSNLQPEILNYEPKEALTDNKDGYSFYELISLKAKHILKQHGQVFFEVGQGQSQKVSSLLKENGFDKIQIIKDYLNIDRVVIGELK